jgi:hypothetical protein
MGGRGFWRQRVWERCRFPFPSVSLPHITPLFLCPSVSTRREGIEEAAEKKEIEREVGFLPVRRSVFFLLIFSSPL